MSELNNIALKIIGNGKGILAADESTGTMTKRLQGVNVESNPENRLKFRHTLFSSKSMKTCIGGVILYDETIKQEFNSKRIPDLISDTGAVPGIKVDTGAKTLANSPEEKITEGLDGLRDRLKDYYKLGARFTKWRGVYVISNNHHTLPQLFQWDNGNWQLPTVANICGYLNASVPPVSHEIDFNWRGAMSEIVLIFHFMIVLFFIAGFFIGLVWNQSMFRYIHAGCLGGITLLMVLRIPCHSRYLKSHCVTSLTKVHF